MQLTEMKISRLASRRASLVLRLDDELSPSGFIKS